MLLILAKVHQMQIYYSHILHRKIDVKFPFKMHNDTILFYLNTISTICVFRFVFNNKFHFPQCNIVKLSSIHKKILSSGIPTQWTSVKCTWLIAFNGIQNASAITMRKMHAIIFKFKVWSLKKVLQRCAF